MTVKPKGVKNFTNLHDFKTTHLYCALICFRLWYDFRQQYSIFVLNIFVFSRWGHKKDSRNCCFILSDLSTVDSRNILHVQVCSKEKNLYLKHINSGKQISPIVLQWEFNKFEIPGGGPPPPPHLSTSVHANKVYDVKQIFVIQWEFFMDNNY